VKDLLSEDDRPVTVHGTDQEVHLQGAVEQEVAAMPDFLELLQRGAQVRATEETAMNQRSSRSHAILTIMVEQRIFVDGGAAAEGAAPAPAILTDTLHAKLQLVDLAGSERVKQTQATGLRFEEGVQINKSLSALGNVILALERRASGQGGHVPYRDHIITRLLQDSLGGNSKTLLIACVSPAEANYEQTLSTLQFAKRACTVQNKPTVNRDPTISTELLKRHTVHAPAMPGSLNPLRCPT
jgi:hypothetical protein